MSLPIAFARAALLPALVAGGLALDFRPEPGSECAKRFALVETLELGEFRVLMNGAEVPAMFLPKMEMELEERRELAVLDRYVAVEGGRPRELVRRYETIAREGRFAQRVASPGAPEEERGSTLEGASELEGAGVVFTWDAERDRYRTAWEDAGREGAPPAALFADLDLCFLLPEGEVAEGETWAVPAEALAPLLELGDDLELELEGEALEEWEPEYESEERSGELTLRLDAVRGEGAARRARVALAGTLTWRGERPGDLSQVPVAEGAATQVDTKVLELEGELIWDLALGRAEALDLRARVELESVTTQDGDGAGYEHALVFEGELALTLTTAAE